MKILNSGGIVFYVLPERQFTIDKYREITSWDHILRDYREGPEWSLKDHYIDWYDNSELGRRKPGTIPYSEKHPGILVERSIATKNNIHFHV